MKKYAVIVAGGEGNRAGGSVPKQFRLIGGVPMLWWSVRAFHKEDPSTEIIIVMHPGYFDYWDILHSELPEADRLISTKIVCGGRSRTESVANGLNSVVLSEDTYVAVHDAARPLVSVEMISRGWAAAERDEAAIPVIPETDSLRRLTEDGSVAVARRDFVRVQTPQVFECRLLKEAYSQPFADEMTDDASVVEAFGAKIALYEGDSHNIKVTNPEDFRIVEVLGIKY